MHSTNYDYSIRATCIKHDSMLAALSHLLLYTACTQMTIKGHLPVEVGCTRSVLTLYNDTLYVTER